MTAQRQSARQRVDAAELTSDSLYQTLVSILPRRNDYGVAGFAELVPELARYGITTVGAFRRLMTSQRRALLTMDRRRLQGWERRHLGRIYGAQFVAEAGRRQFWFAYAALVRIAAELEFGVEAAVRGAASSERAVMTRRLTAPIDIGPAVVLDAVQSSAVDELDAEYEPLDERAASDRVAPRIAANQLR